MSDGGASEVTRILHEWNNGSTDAKEKLLPFVYDELKRQARILMSSERRDHTLQPTALVHETFIRLEKQSAIEWKDRSHFYGIASRLMRQILVDHARRYAAAKRGSGSFHISLEDIQVTVAQRAGSLIEINDALDALERLDKRQASIVEMRFFGGLGNAEIAETLGISERTVGREWQVAKLWLTRELDLR